MIDDKTRAKVLREYADKWAEISSETANCIRDDADELTPSTPEQGVCRFTWGSKIDWFDGIVVGCKVYFSVDGKSLDWKPAETCEIRPARILAPGQVAVYQEVLMNAKYLLEYGGSFARSIAAQLRAALDRDAEARR